MRFVRKGCPDPKGDERESKQAGDDPIADRSHFRIVPTFPMGSTEDGGDQQQGRKGCQTSNTTSFSNTLALFMIAYCCILLATSTTSRTCASAATMLSSMPDSLW